MILLALLIVIQSVIILLILLSISERIDRVEKITQEAAHHSLGCFTLVKKFDDTAESSSPIHDAQAKEQEVK